MSLLGARTSSARFCLQLKSLLVSDCTAAGSDCGDVAPVHKVQLVDVGRANQGVLDIQAVKSKCNLPEAAPCCNLCACGNKQSRCKPGRWAGLREQRTELLGLSTRGSHLPFPGPCPAAPAAERALVEQSPRSTELSFS